MEMEQIINENKELTKLLDDFVITIIAYQYHIEVYKADEQYEKCAEFVKLIDKEINKVSGNMCKISDKIDIDNVKLLLTTTIDNIKSHYELIKNDEE